MNQTEIERESVRINKDNNIWDENILRNILKLRNIIMYLHPTPLALCNLVLYAECIFWFYSLCNAGPVKYKHFKFVTISSTIGLYACTQLVYESLNFSKYKCWYNFRFFFFVSKPDLLLYCSFQYSTTQWMYLYECSMYVCIGILGKIKCH